ncbi:MAG: hypothetical protein R2830_19335 [Saprospiraceae bacterium]
MTNIHHLANSVEAARLRSVTELQDYLFGLAEKGEREERLDAASSYAPKMLFHRLANVGWIVAVDLDGFFRPCHQNSFARLSLPALKAAGLAAHIVNDFTLFVRSNEPEERIREEIALACSPF